MGKVKRPGTGLLLPTLIGILELPVCFTLDTLYEITKNKQGLCYVSMCL